MKFKILRSKFFEGLKLVQNIVGGKGSFPALQNVLLEAVGKDLKMTTTDLEISIMCVCACDVQQEGSTTLPVKFLFNAIAKMAEGEVTVEVDANERAEIKCANTKFKLAGLPVSDFPKLPKNDEANIYKIDQATLKEMLRKVSYAASQDDTRRTLKGVLMSFKDEKLTMVATDGRRLAMVNNPLEFPKSDERDIVLPAKVVSELQRTLNGSEVIEVKIQKSQICFKLDTLTIYSKLIEDTYPNYVQVIPKEIKEKIVVDRQLLLEAIDRVSVMTIDEAHSTKLIFESGKLTVTSAASDIGEAKDVVPIKYVGEKIEIMFNPSYVMEALRVIDEDEVTLNLKDGHSPALINCSIPFIYVLMPLRIGG